MHRAHLRRHAGRSAGNPFQPHPVRSPLPRGCQARPDAEPPPAGLRPAVRQLPLRSVTGVTPGERASWERTKKRWGERRCGTETRKDAGTARREGRRAVPWMPVWWDMSHRRCQPRCARGGARRPDPARPGPARLHTRDTPPPLSGRREGARRLPGPTGPGRPTAPRRAGCCCPLEQSPPSCSGRPGPLAAFPERAVLPSPFL